MSHRVGPVDRIGSRDGKAASVDLQDKVQVAEQITRSGDLLLSLATPCQVGNRLIDGFLGVGRWTLVSTLPVRHFGLQGQVNVLNTSGSHLLQNTGRHVGIIKLVYMMFRYFF